MKLARRSRAREQASHQDWRCQALSFSRLGYGQKADKGEKKKAAATS